MVTKKYVGIARMYANKKERTVFENIQLVKFFIMLGDKNKITAYEKARRLKDYYPHNFDRLLQESIKHFKNDTLY